VPIPVPQLPESARRAFVVALHRLYDEAGQPPTRAIDQATHELPREFATVSHQTVSAMLHGKALPGWPMVWSVAVALAELAGGSPDRPELEQRFKTLWLAARREGAPGPATEAADPPPPIHPTSSNRAIRPEDIRRPRIEISSEALTTPVVGDLPDRDPHFTGRADLLEHVRASLLANPHTPLVLHGVSGVGKSQVAREYVERYGPEHRITWWVLAESVDHVRRSLVDLAGRLGVGIGPNSDQTVDAVISRLESQPSPYLIVLDGARELGIRRLMPTFRGHVIVTTQDPAWGHDSSSVGIEVPDFDADEAVSYLQKRDPSLSAERASELVRLVGRLPLALAHVAALHQAPDLPWDDLLRQLSVSMATAHGPKPYPPSVSASVEYAVRTFEENDQVAMLVLELFAWLGSEPVSVALLRQGRAGDPSVVTPALLRALRSPVDVRKALRAIQQMGLARLRADQRVEVQPTTRLALRDVLSAAALERARRNTHQILAASGLAVPDDVASSGMHREIAPHVVPADLIGSTATAVLRTVYHQVRYRYLVGDYAAACSLASSAVTAWKSNPALGPSHELVWRTIHEWANGLREQGQYLRAQKLTEDAMARLRADPRFGRDHQLTLSICSSHGSDLRIAGEYRLAYELDLDTYQRCVHQVGRSHPRAATSRHNLAVSLRHVGDFAGAEAADRTTLHYHLGEHGSDDWRTLLSLNALGEDLCGLARYAEVLSLRTHRSVTTRRRPGPLDRGALLLRRTTALACRGVGQLDAAVDMARDHYEECGVVLGPDHQYTLAASMTYANTLRLVGRPGEAFDYATDAVLAYARTFGPRNPLTRVAEVSLAAILRARGDLVHAREADAAARDGLHAALGERHPFTIAATAGLASDYALEGDARLAVRESEHAYGAALDAFGPTHPGTVAIASNLALDRAAVGDRAGSDALGVEILAALGEERGGQSLGRAIERGRRAEYTIEPPST
jgi:hypothetical protein